MTKKIKELENELALARAEARGLGSQLLDVQQDCINARKTMAEEIMRGVTRKQFLTLPLSMRRAIIKIQAESIAPHYGKEDEHELLDYNYCLRFSRI